MRLTRLYGRSQASSGSPEDASQHSRSELTRKRVLLAGVIGADQDGLPGRGLVLPPVSEAEFRSAVDDSATTQDGKVDVEGQPAKRDDHADVAEQYQFALQIGPAVADLIGRWFVIRGDATDGCGDVGVFEHQPVIPRGTERRGGESRVK